MKLKLSSFLETHLEWQIPECTVRFDTNDLDVNNADLAGEVVKICDHSCYWVNYTNNENGVLPSGQAKKKYAELVIEFLQENLEWN